MASISSLNLGSAYDGTMASYGVRCIRRVALTARYFAVTGREMAMAGMWRVLVLARLF